jgi:hypothetical protein
MGGKHPSTNNSNNNNIVANNWLKDIFAKESDQEKRNVQQVILFTQPWLVYLILKNFKFDAEHIPNEIHLYISYLFLLLLKEQLFPLYEIQLGITDVDLNALMKKYKNITLEKQFDFSIYRYNLNFVMSLFLICRVDGHKISLSNGAVQSIYFNRGLAFPPRWAFLGLDWDLSYDEWLDLLTIKLGAKKVISCYG